MITTNVSLTEFHDQLIARMVGAYAPSKSGVIRYLIQSYVLEHGDDIKKRLDQYEEWKRKNFK